MRGVAKTSKAAHLQEMAVLLLQIGRVEGSYSKPWVAGVPEFIDSYSIYELRRKKPSVFNQLTRLLGCSRQELAPD
jgi:hypothetical protein